MTELGAKGAATRQRMIDAGIELMRGAGLAGAGINDLVAASGAPKGSVFHFFPGGKHQLVDEALAEYTARVHAWIEDAMAAARTPAAKVRALFAAFAQRLEAADFRRSCAAGAVCLDLDAGSKACAVRSPPRSTTGASFSRGGSASPTSAARAPSLDSS